MAKFTFLCSRDRVAVIKIGKSLYYVDLINPFDILIYDSDFIKQNIIVPEYWLPEVTRGDVTFAVLKHCSQAYEMGFQNGKSIKAKKFFDEFCQRLVETISSPKSAESFISLFWVELKPYDIVKSLISRLISNKEIRDKSPITSRIALDRFIKRAASDTNARDAAISVIADLPSQKFAPHQQLLDVLEIEADNKVSSLNTGIDIVIGKRKNAGT